MIYVEDSPSVPCGYLVCDTGSERNLIVQTDWDFPGLASCMGYVPCNCGETDGTVDCAHKTASQMIEEARQYIDDHLEEEYNDPGYFA